MRQDLLTIALREKLTRSQIERAVRPIMRDTQLWDDLASGTPAVTRLFYPAFHFNALAMSQVAPPGALVLHLGSESSHFLGYLALRRPDIRIIALEQNADSAKRSEAVVSALGLSDRITTYQCGFANFSQQTPDAVNVIASVDSLHTIASDVELNGCLHEVALCRIRSGASVWISDFARPRLSKTIEDFSGTASNGLPGGFLRLQRNSALSSFTFRELTEAIDRQSFGQVEHYVSKPLGILQAHLLKSDLALQAGHAAWSEPTLPGPVIRDFKEYCDLLSTVPLPPHLK